MRSEKSQSGKRRIFFDFKRLLSLWTLTAFLGTQHLLPPAYAANPSADSGQGKSIPIDSANFQIPKDLGKIEESYQGKGNQTVLLIQDAHAIPEAQRSIQKLIDYFHKEYGIRTVALEGASSKLDLQIFKSFPDKALLKKTFEEYLERGELTGAVAAALESDLLFQGIEDWALYEEALALYLKALEKEPELLKKLEAERQRNREAKKKVYSPKLLEIDEALENFQENHAHLIALLKSLASIKRPEKGSQLALILEEIEKQGKDTSSIDSEVRRVAEKIRSSLSARGGSLPGRQADASGGRARRHSEGEARRISGTEILPLRYAQRQDDLIEFNQKFQAFQTSQISAPDFALWIREKGTDNTSLSVPFSKHLARLVENARRLKELEGTKFFKDFEAYADSVKETLFRNEEEKALNEETHKLHVLGNLIRLKLSPEEWDEIKQTTDQRPQTEDLGEKSLWSSAFGLLSFHLAFYENAAQRDEAFLRNLTALMKKNKRPSLRGSRPADEAISETASLPSVARNDNTVLFIAGGFHAEGLTQRLKERGISYLLVSPKMNSVPKETAYQSLMRGEVSWKDYFEVEKGKVNLYKAFVRGTRDRLLKQVEGRGWKVEGKTEPSSFDLRPSTFHLLKEWRDQLIRDLAEKEEITKVHEYTPFLDELTKTDSQKPWMVKLERFIQGLRSLESQGALTERNVLRLLRQVTLNQATVVPWAGPASASRSKLPLFNNRLGVPYFPYKIRGWDGAALALPKYGPEPSVPSAPTAPARRLARRAEVRAKRGRRQKVEGGSKSEESEHAIRSLPPASASPSSGFRLQASGWRRSRRSPLRSPFDSPPKIVGGSLRAGRF